jgi:pyruvate formate lyase activating enzyme
LLHATHKQIRIRFLVIPGLTDAETHLKKLGSFVQQLNNLECMELLQYGTHGKHKWEELYGNYPLEGVPDATRADLDRAARVLKQYSLPLLY